MGEKSTETKNDLKDKVSIIEIIQDIDARLTHLEDMQMDNRELIVKLIKQGNTIVEFLKDFQLEPIDEEELAASMSTLPPLPETEGNKRIEKTTALKELIDEMINRHSDLKEFEEELRKHKDKITPGQVGES